MTFGLWCWVAWGSSGLVGWLSMRKRVDDEPWLFENGLWIGLVAGAWSSLGVVLAVVTLIL